MCLCVLGLSLESDTGLSPVETDTDSHRPLMSDEEDEVEVYGRQSVQQPDEPLAESPRAIGFCQAFCLPGVLCVSVELKSMFIKPLAITRTTQLSHPVDSVSVCAAVFSGLCMSEAGQLLLLLLASFLPEQQLWLEGG